MKPPQRPDSSCGSTGSASTLPSSLTRHHRFRATRPSSCVEPLSITAGRRSNSRWQSRTATPPSGCTASPRGRARQHHSTRMLRPCRRGWRPHGRHRLRPGRRLSLRRPHAAPDARPVRGGACRRLTSARDRVSTRRGVADWIVDDVERRSIGCIVVAGSTLCLPTGQPVPDGHRGAHIGPQPSRRRARPRSHSAVATSPTDHPHFTGIAWSQRSPRGADALHAPRVAGHRNPEEFYWRSYVCSVAIGRGYLALSANAAKIALIRSVSRCASPARREHVGELRPST